MLLLLSRSSLTWFTLLLAVTCSTLVLVTHVAKIMCGFPKWFFYFIVSLYDNTDWYHCTSANNVLPPMGAGTFPTGTMEVNHPIGQVKCIRCCARQPGWVHQQAVWR